MSNILVESPFEYLTDRTGRTLANGKIYIGQPGQDPISFPQNAFFDLAGTIPAPQPIRTNSAGFPCDVTGNPQRIFTVGDYSIRVTDQNDAQVVYAASAADGFFGVTANDLANNTDPAKGSGMVGFVYQVGAAGQTVQQRLNRGWVDVKDFGAVGDNLANDKAAFDAAASTGRTILLPAGTYNVPSGDYSASRFYSFDGATTNNGTISIVDPLSNSLPVGFITGFPCTSPGLPFGWLECAGQILNRTVYAELWGFAQGSNNIVNQVDKAANPGAFGRGDGVSTFSLPDLRGTSMGSANNGSGVDTSFIIGKRVTVTAGAGAAISVSTTIETYAIRAFGRAVNEGSVDVQALQAQVAAFATTLSTAFGLGQTTQIFTGLRSAGVPYTNTTARPIMVTVSGISVSTLSTMDLFVGGVLVAQAYHTVTAGASASGGQVSWIVNPGETYQVNVSGFVVNIWAEYRE